MSLPVEIADYIRAEVARQRIRSIASASIVDVPDARTVSVTFDGSSSPKLVRILGDATANAGERAILVMVDDEWVCVGTKTPHPAPPIPAFEISEMDSSMSGTTTSGSYVDFANTAQVTFVKASADYRTILRMEGTLYVAVSDGAGVQFGVRVDGSTDVDVQQIAATNAMFNQHTPYGRQVEIPGLAVGSHTFKPRWKRVSGTGTLKVDGGDNFTMTIWEVPV